MLTVKQASERLKISKQSVNNHMKRNNLTYHKDESTNMNYVDSEQFDILHQSVATNNQQTSTNTDNDTANTDQQPLSNEQLLSIIHDQQQTIKQQAQTIHELSTKQSQALINAQVIQREQLDTAHTDSDSGTVTHRHTDTTEDAQRGYNKGTDSAEDTTHVTSTNKSEDIEDGKEAVATDKDSKKHKRGFWDKLFGGK